MCHSNDLSVTISNLTRARDFISNPSNWGKGDYLTCDLTGFDYQACVQGALQWIGVELPQCRAAARMLDPEYEVPLEHTYIDQAVRSLDCGYNDVISFNDAPETTHEDVMRLFNRAIHLAMADALQSAPQALTAPEPVLEEA
jgi:hypothetical protein